MILWLVTELEYFLWGAHLFHYFLILTDDDCVLVIFAI